MNVKSWIWLIDMERTISFTIGQCLGEMLQGPLCSPEEVNSAYWLQSQLLSNGLEIDTERLGRPIFIPLFLTFGEKLCPSF